MQMNMGKCQSSMGYGASNVGVKKAIRICWKSFLVLLVLVQCDILADNKVTHVLTYRNHVNNTWAHCSLIAHELLDVSWHTNVTSRNYSLFCYSLQLKVKNIRQSIYPLCYMFQLMKWYCTKSPDAYSNLPSGFVMLALMQKPAFCKIRMVSDGSSSSKQFP